MYNDGEASHDRQVDDAQRLPRLEAIVLAMPAKRRAVFVLSRIEGLTNAEVAAHCGISIKMVEKHIAGAREMSGRGRAQWPSIGLGHRDEEAHRSKDLVAPMMDDVERCRESN